MAKQEGVLHGKMMLPSFDSSPEQHATAYKFLTWYVF